MVVLSGICAAAVPAAGEVMPVNMSFYKQVDSYSFRSGVIGYSRTSIYRGFVSGDVQSVTIHDSGAGGADPGTFSGMDVDFILFDRDGNLRTTNDQILPSLDPTRTYVTPGTVKTPVGNFGATSNRPGKLFGLNASNQLDNSIAKIHRRDAWYPAVPDKNVVRDSSGWVSLGINGSMHVEFDGMDDGDWYLFIGEVGLRNEPVQMSAEMGEVLIELTGLEPVERTLFAFEDATTIDGVMPGSTGIERYEWKIGESGTFQADPLGQTAGVGGPPPDLRQLDMSYAELALLYPGLINVRTTGTYDPTDPTLMTIPIYMRVHTTDGGFTDFLAADITLVQEVIPEPTSLSLVALGGLAVIRRRRR
jgi:hypothetical protein